MKQKLLIFLTGFFVGCLNAYDIEKSVITVNVVNKNEIVVALPYNPEVVSVFFTTQLDDDCNSTSYNVVHNDNKTSSLGFKQHMKKELKDKDTLRVHGFFETHNEVISKSFEFKIDANGNAIKQNISENVSENIECEQKKSVTEIDGVAEGFSDTLVFEDNFNEDLSKWKHEIYSPILSGDAEFVVFDDNEKNCYLNNSLLYINATWNLFTYEANLEKCTIPPSNELYELCCTKIINPPALSAKLNSEFQFKYGRVEISLRMPIGDWLFPYIMLQPANTRNKHIMVNQIRMYARGNRLLVDKQYNLISGGVLFGSLVDWSQGALKEYKTMKSHLPNHLFGNDFHNYTIIWRKDRIIFKVDGFTYGTIDDKKALKEFSKENCFIVLGLTAGGNTNFPDDVVQSGMKVYGDNTTVNVQHVFSEKVDRKTWTQASLIIDHVRVYTIHEYQD